MFCRVEYFSADVGTEPGAACQLLSRLAAQRVDLRAAFTVPGGPRGSWVHLFPVDSRDLMKAARVERLPLTGPCPAILVHERDRIGAFACVLGRLVAAGVEPTSGHAVSDGRGRFAYFIPLEPEQVDAALRALKVPA